MDSDLLNRRLTKFVLWAPRQSAPKLVIGTLQCGAPPSLQGEKTIALTAVSGKDGLWEIAPSACGLSNGGVYHYWFHVDDTRPGHTDPDICVTDPFAFTVDWRLTRGDGDQPASVIKFENGNLLPCDPDGTSVTEPAPGDLKKLAQNNFTVIYELPAAWTRQPRGSSERGVGTFRDIVAMLDKDEQSPNFDELEAASRGHAHIAELGINAIELLPPADSYYEREWGYGTSHMFTPDYELGHPDFNSWPTANADLRLLAETCHALNIRLIDDVVMGFARSGPYEHIDFDDFHIAFDPKNSPRDPDAWTSRPHEARQNFGSTLWRYVKKTTTYDPMTGNNADFRPARHLHFLAQKRWMQDFHIDGFRIDSVETVANWDFIGDFTNYARQHFRTRCTAQGLSDPEADARFLVIGEELQLPIALITQKRVTSLWNDKFREYLRPAVLGQSAGSESTFEWTVKKMVECSYFGFSDGAEAVNYIGSHDVEGVHKERIATMFRYQFPIDDSMSDDEKAQRNAEIGRRVKLSFACLLTAVGIPMILAGDEFADENDLFDMKGNVTNQGGKQIDPVNFGRLEGDENEWRCQVLIHVQRLIELRKTHPALGLNDTTWLHMDFTPGRRVMAWQRGSDDNPVIVVANFSDFQTDDPSNGSRSMSFQTGRVATTFNGAKFPRQGTFHSNGLLASRCIHGKPRYTLTDDQAFSAPARAECSWLQPPFVSDNIQQYILAQIGAHRSQ
jgi:pullulanase